MKHNLFLTMLAAALLGGQVFAETVYKVSDYYEGDRLDVPEQEATVIVDAQITLAIFRAGGSQCLTLDFRGDFVLTTMHTLDTPDSGVLNITSTVDAVITKWEDTFSVEGGGSITLCHSGIEIDSDYGSFQLFGQEAGSTVQLGNTDVKFVGLVDAFSALDMNQVGVVCNYDNICLVGKVQKSVPEPTTGSLGLFALVGLCMRKRRK